MHFTWGLGPKPKPETDPETLRRLERIDRRLDGIYIALERARERSMATTEVVQRLVTEVEQTQGKIASVLAFVAGVPALILAAVEEVLGD